MPNQDPQHGYTRDELLSLLQEEGTPLKHASLRKAIRLGLVARPRQISAGRGQLRSEYSRLALAQARALARHIKQGKSIGAFKALTEKARIRGMPDALDLVEAAARFHARRPSAIGKHAVLALEEVLLANPSPPSAEIRGWLAGLKQEACALSAVPSHNLRNSWLAWVAKVRAKSQELALGKHETTG